MVEVFADTVVWLVRTATDIRGRKRAARVQVQAVQAVEARLLMSGVPAGAHAVYASGSVVTEDIEGAAPFQATQRWTTTATDGAGLGQGDVTTITWSIVADGTLTDNGVASNLIAFMDANFGAGPGGTDLTLRPWFSIYQASHDRMEELSGINFEYVAYDDGVQMSESNRGILGVRADMRIMGQDIDGPFNILAYNFYPAFGGDMVIDTSDQAFYTGNANNFRGFRNVVMHEMGHGVGMAHVESDDSEFLMEPFINTNFDGLQLDDILLMHRHYGDAGEKLGGNTVGSAIDLGGLISGTPISRGTLGDSTVVAGTVTDFLSIDDDSDVDVFSFTAATGGRVTIDLTARGTTYQQGPQNGPAPQPNFNSRSQNNLALELIGPDGITVLSSVDVGGLGVGEAINNFQVTAGETYFIRVTGSTADTVQLYGLDLSLNADLGVIAGTVFNDPNSDGFQNPGEAGLAGRTVTLDRILPAATYTSDDLNLSIADNESVTSTLIVATGNPSDVLSDINVFVDLYSYYDLSAISLTLISPDGVEIPLAIHDGVGGNSYFVTFDDSAATSVDGQAGSLSGSYRPESPLSVLNGTAINGVWSLRISDDVADDGFNYLYDWGIEVVQQERYTTTTNGLGQYTFDNLPAGTYVVTPTLAPNYTPTVPSSGSRTIFLADDAAEVNQNFGAKTISSPPVLGNFGGTIVYNPRTSIYIDQDATLTDADSPNLNGGRLDIAFTVGSEATNRLSIRNQGTTSGLIGFDGTNVRYSGVVIGTATGGVNALTVNFNSQATPAAVQALIRNLTYTNTSNTPADVDRTLSLTVRDGGGGVVTATKTIQINVAPVIAGFDGSVSYTPGTTIYLDQDATVSDSDSPNFDGGQLTALFSVGAETNNTIGIRNAGIAPGQVALSGSNVLVSGVVIGTYSGGTGTTQLRVLFNNKATAAAVQILLRNLTYTNTAASPLIMTRTVAIAISDGDGATSLVSTKNISLPPRIGNFSDTTQYRPSTTIYLDQDVFVTGGTADFNGGTLTIQFLSGSEANNRLSVRNAGTGPGQTSLVLNGQQTFVLYQGVYVGMLTGGIGTSPLVITFNSSATLNAVQGVMRNITYANTAQTPPTVRRVLSMTLTDSTGTSSLPAQKVVNFVPVIEEFSDPLNYRAGTTVYVDQNALAYDLDSSNFSGGKLVVWFGSGVESFNLLAIRNAGMGGGQTAIVGNKVYYSGIEIGTFSGGVGTTPLTVNFSVQANRNAVQAVVRNLTYRNTATTPANLSRMINIQLTDSDGGLSVVASKLVVVS